MLAVSESGIGAAFDYLAKKAASFLEVWSGKGESKTDDPRLLFIKDLTQLTGDELISALGAAQAKFEQTMGSPYWGERIKRIQEQMAANALKARDFGTELEKPKPILDSLNNKLTELKNQRTFATTEAEVKALNIEIAILEARISSLLKGPETFGDLPGKTTITPLQSLNDDTIRLTLSSEELAKTVGEAIPPAFAVAEASITEFGQALQNIAQAGITGAMDVLADALSGENVLQSFGSFLSRLGRMMMAYGALMATKSILEQVAKTGGPQGIAAGIALVAVGAAAVAVGASIGRATSPGAGFGGGGGGGFSAGSYGSYGGGTFGGGGYAYEREIVLVARGDDLVGVINRNNFRNGENM
jgi:hypothetical protein